MQCLQNPSLRWPPGVPETQVTCPKDGHQQDNWWNIQNRQKINLLVFLWFFFCVFMVRCLWSWQRQMQHIVIHPPKIMFFFSFFSENTKKLTKLLWWNYLGEKNRSQLLVSKTSCAGKKSSYIYINSNLFNCILTKVFQAKEQNYVIIKTLGKRYVIDEEKSKKA